MKPFSVSVIGSLALVEEQGSFRVSQLTAMPDPHGPRVPQEAQKPLAEQRPLPARPERLNAILMGQKCPVLA